MKVTVMCLGASWIKEVSCRESCQHFLYKYFDI